MRRGEFARTSRRGCVVWNSDRDGRKPRTAVIGITIAQLSVVLIGTFTLVLTNSQTADATVWGLETEISTDAGTESQFTSDVVVEGGWIHVIWRDHGQGDSDIFYRLFNGVAWQQEIELSSDLGADLQYPPSIAVEGAEVHTAWVDKGFGDLEVYYRRFDGFNWGPEENVSVGGDPLIFNPPGIAVDGSKVHMVWDDGRDGDRDIYYRQFNGISWESEIELSSDTAAELQEHPSVAAENGRVHVVWQDDGYVNYRNFDGSSWGQELMISEGSGYSPSIAAENGEVHVVWQDAFFPSNDIYYKHFDGSTWHPKVELGVEAPCGGRQIDADVAAEGNKVHVVWVEMRGFENDICYAYFNGNEWLPPQEISTDSGGEEQHRPSIAVEGGLAYVTWEDKGGGDYDIVLREGVEDFTQPVSSLDPTGGYWKTTDTYDIGWWANDDFGLARVTLFYKFSADNTVWSSWNEYGFDDTVSGTSASGTFSFTAPDGDGHYEFYSIATDTSGNEDDPPLVADATAGVDMTQPTGLVIVNNGDEWTSSTSVTLTLDYQDNTSGVDQIRFRNDGTWDTEPWESPVQTTTWALETGEGTKTVHYQIRDIAGLESMTYSDDISLDATPPTGTISINDGNELTNSLSVSLKLTYSDSLSGVSQIRFSNDDVWDAVPWESPSLTRAWTLSTGQGTKTVHYRVIDDAGLESISFSDEIELDQTPPSIESIAPAHGATGIEITETVRVTFTEMISRPVETGSIALRTNGTEVDFTIEWSTDNRTAILQPTMNLKNGTTYQVIITTGVTDRAGNDLAFASETSFTTKEIEDIGNGDQDTGGEDYSWIIVLIVVILVVVVVLVVWKVRKKRGN